MTAVYLDYAATTPLDPQVAERMREVQSSAWANPASTHVLGRAAADIVDHAEAQVRSLLNAADYSVLWTSGATESNNLAIVGAAKQRAHRGKHLITTRTEHKAVVDVFRALEKQGFEVTWLPAGVDGELQPQTLREALREDTTLVSLMYVNNETGLIHDVAAFGEICREHGALLHVDAAQAAGKIPVDLAALPIDLLSLTAHKYYGPKGVGALLVAPNVHLEPLLFGGGQQRRLRPGTVPVDLVAGLGEAAAVAEARIESDLEHLEGLRAALFTGISAIDGIRVNGPETGGYPGILNVSAAGIEGESLLLALEPLCVAAGSACNAQSREPSQVLRAIGLSDSDAQSAIRFSLGRPTTAEDIRFAVDHYRAAVAKLRELAP